MSDNQGPSVREVDFIFVTALILGLRVRGLSVGPADSSGMLCGSLDPIGVGPG